MGRSIKKPPRQFGQRRNLIYVLLLYVYTTSTHLHVLPCTLLVPCSTKLRGTQHTPSFGWTLHTEHLAFCHDKQTTEPGKKVRCQWWTEALFGLKKPEQCWRWRVSCWVHSEEVDHLWYRTMLTCCRLKELHHSAKCHCCCYRTEAFVHGCRRIQCANRLEDIHRQALADKLEIKAFDVHVDSLEFTLLQAHATSLRAILHTIVTAENITASRARNHCSTVVLQVRNSLAKAIRLHSCRVLVDYLLLFHGGDFLLHCVLALHITALLPPPASRVIQHPPVQSTCRCHNHLQHLVLAYQCQKTW